MEGRFLVALGLVLFAALMLLAEAVPQVTRPSKTMAAPFLARKASVGQSQGQDGRQWMLSASALASGGASADIEGMMASDPGSDDPASTSMRSQGSRETAQGGRDHSSRTQEQQDTTAVGSGSGGGSNGGSSGALVLTSSGRNRRTIKSGTAEEAAPGEAMLVVTADGELHCVGADGQVRWTSPLGGPIASSYQAAPKATPHGEGSGATLASIDGTSPRNRPSGGKSGSTMVPALDGSVLVHTGAQLGYAPFSVAQLVERAPFLAADGTFYFGDKKTTLVRVDLETGELVMSGAQAPVPEPGVVWMSKVEFTVRAMDSRTNTEKWNFTTTALESIDNLPPGMQQGPTGEEEDDPSDDQHDRAHSIRHRSVEATADGRLSGVRGRSESLQFATPVSHVFGVRSSPQDRHNAAAEARSLRNQASGLLPDRQQEAQEEGRDASGPSLYKMTLNHVRTKAFDVAPGDEEGLTALVGDHGDGRLFGMILQAAVSSRADPLDASSLQPMQRESDTSSGVGNGGMDSERQLSGKGSARALPSLPRPPRARIASFQRAASGSVATMGSTLTNLTTTRALAMARTAATLCQPHHHSYPHCLVGLHALHRLPLSHSSYPDSLANRARPGLHPSEPQGGGLGPHPYLPAGGEAALPEPPQPSGPSSSGGMNSGGASSTGSSSSESTGLHKLMLSLGLSLLALVCFMAVSEPRVLPLKVRRVLAVIFDQDRTDSQAPLPDMLGLAPRADSAPGLSGGGMDGREMKLERVGDSWYSLVGKLKVSDQCLGRGSMGTIVFRGLLDDRPVAVKRMLKEYHAAAAREIELLIKSDGHANVVRYFFQETAGDFLYLALELCALTLHEATQTIRRRYLASLQARGGAKGQGQPPGVGELEGQAVEAVRGALLDVARGVQYLHDCRIVHRDLKPHNILLAPRTAWAPSEASAEEITALRKSIEGAEDLSSFCLKISDMGLGKILVPGQSSLALPSHDNHPHPAGLGSGGGSSDGSEGSGRRGAGSANGSHEGGASSSGAVVGTSGWQAPEIMALRTAAERAGTHGTILDPAGSNLDDPARDTTGPGLDGHDIDGDAGQEAEGHGGQDRAASSSSSSGSSSSAPSKGASSQRTFAVDIFSLGCLFFNVLVPGSHPFGDQWYDREANVARNKFDLSPMGDRLADAQDLVARMISADPLKRPSAAQTIAHPFFWGSEKRLSFLVTFSDRIEQERDPTSPLLRGVEANAADVVGHSWDDRLHPDLTNDVGKFRRYDVTLVRDCLRVIRNKTHHWQELPPKVQQLLQPFPAGVFRYFDARFPRLLFHCYRVTERWLSHDRLFSEYLLASSSTRIKDRSTTDGPASSTRDLVPPPATAAIPTTAAAAKTSVPLVLDPTGSRSSEGYGLEASEGAPQEQKSELELETPKDLTTESENNGHFEAELRDEGASATGSGSGSSSAVTSSVESKGEDKDMVEGAVPVPVQVQAEVEADVHSGASASQGLSAAMAPSTGLHDGDGEAERNAEAASPTGVPDPDLMEGLEAVVLWKGTDMSKAFADGRGWYRPISQWQREKGSSGAGRGQGGSGRPPGSSQGPGIQQMQQQLERCAQDLKYRSRLCNHWDSTLGTFCPMRCKGKCDFAHGPLELRVRDNKRNRWGRLVDDNGDPTTSPPNANASGGEDTYGLARSIERLRKEDGRNAAENWSSSSGSGNRRGGGGRGKRGGRGGRGAHGGGGSGGDDRS